MTKAMTRKTAKRRSNIPSNAGPVTLPSQDRDQLQRGLAYDLPMPQILVIDDDPEIRDILTQFLKSNGYGVFEAENGESGLQVFDSNPIDLVLTDIVMPGKEGLETIMELKQKNPRLRIIAMSGGSIRSGEYLSYAQKFGANRLIEKPFDLQAVLQAIRELLAS